MDKELQLWGTLPENSKRNIISAISKKTKLPFDAIEKDWWVVQML
jgi:hypothetical protein